MNAQQKAIVKALAINLKMVSRKGWYTTDCPFCGKKKKFGVRFNDDVRFRSDSEHKNKISFNCYRGKCGESGAGNKLLKHLGLSHLISNIEYLEDRVEIKKEEAQEEIDVTTPKRMKPIFFKRCSSNEYLEGRGFEPWQFEAYQIGTSKKIKDRIIFLIIEDGEIKGWVGRTTLTADEIKEKERDGFYVPKYKNDTADFSKLLFGIDQVEKGDSVILVEGVTDKANIDRILRGLELENVKSICTFGKKISEVQLKKIQLKEPSDIIFLYDPDAIAESKKYSLIAQDFIESVKVGLLKGNEDAGDISAETFLEIVSELRSPLDFSTNVVNKLVLR